MRERVARGRGEPARAFAADDSASKDVRVVQMACVPGPAGAAGGHLAPAPRVFRVKFDGDVRRDPREIVQVAEEFSYTRELRGNGRLGRGLDGRVHGSVVVCELRFVVVIVGGAGGTLDRDGRPARAIEWGNMRGSKG